MNIFSRVLDQFIQKVCSIHYGSCILALHLQLVPYSSNKEKESRIQQWERGGIVR